MIMMERTFRCYYAENHEKAGMSNFDPSETAQEFADECDINYLVKRYAETGSYFENPLVSPTVRPEFADFSELDASDYQSAMNLFVRAKNEFDALPVAIRKRFGYNPKELLDFLNDRANYDEAVSLGLVMKKDVPVNETSE